MEEEEQIEEQVCVTVIIIVLVRCRLYCRVMVKVIYVSSSKLYPSYSYTLYCQCFSLHTVHIIRNKIIIKRNTKNKA